MVEQVVEVTLRCCRINKLEVHNVVDLVLNQEHVIGVVKMQHRVREQHLEH